MEIPVKPGLNGLKASYAPELVQQNLSIVFVVHAFGICMLKNCPCPLKRSRGVPLEPPLRGHLRDKKMPP